MMVTGNTIRHMVRAPFDISQVTFILVNGLATNQMDLDHIKLLLVPSMKADGKMTSSMVTE